MGMWLVKGDTSIGYWKDPERKKPVFGICEGNAFVGYGQFYDEESAAKFMDELAKFFNIGGAELPTVDAVEVVHWRWILKETCGKNTEKFHCSVCNKIPKSLCIEAYCPNCGAKMDGDGNG